MYPKLPTKINYFTVWNWADFDWFILNHTKDSCDK